MPEQLTDAEADTLITLLAKATGGCKCSKPVRNEAKCWVEEICLSTLKQFQAIVEENNRAKSKFKNLPRNIYP